METFLPSVVSTMCEKEWTTVPSPIETPGPITTKGSIVTSLPNTVSAAR
ncbi:hypothetical protein ACVWWO_000547 [Bradyrhizobium sp. F1.13.1]